MISLRLGNAGDSRAVLSCRGRAVPLSNDHKVNMHTRFQIFRHNIIKKYKSRVLKRKWCDPNASFVNIS